MTKIALGYWMTDVRQWLESLGLARYATTFTDNDVDLEVLPELTDDDLKAIGVSLGHRKKLLKAIRELDQMSSAPSSESTRKKNRAQLDDAERRQLTVLFADLVGSTELSQQLDPEDLDDIIVAYQDACASAVNQYSGYVAKYLGDGVLAYFGYPQAHEDDPERAVHAGLAVVDSMNRLNPDVGDRYSVRLSVRVGIATGLVVVGDRIGEVASEEDAVVGETPNLAARLQGVAEPNTVVVSATTQRLASGQFRYRNRGKHDLKGIAQAVHVWQVLERRFSESRFKSAHMHSLTPLVGRKEELAILKQRLRLAQAGHGQVVLISGEPGLGKSRLCEAFSDWIGNESLAIKRYQCSPYQTTRAFHPVIAQLEHAAGLHSNDTHERKLEKLQSLLRSTPSVTKEDVALVGTLLSVTSYADAMDVEIEPKRFMKRTLATLLKLLTAAGRPMICIFEDTHWSDPTTLTFLDQLVHRIVSAPLLVLITFRPEFRASWTGLSHVSLMALKRLDQRQSVSMVKHIAFDRGIDRSMQKEIADKTDGIPLFIEELARTLVELVHREPNAKVAIDTQIPETLRASLTARLDSLGLGKKVAQLGAAIGREFSRGLAIQAGGLDATEIDTGLMELVNAGLIFRRDADESTSFVFKHALVRDVAYKTLLRKSRERIHAGIVRAYEGSWPEQASTSPELMAHHLELAGLNERAIAYWTKAGQRALALWANEEAATHLSKALHLLDALPENAERLRQELRLRSMLGPVLMILEGFGSSAVKQIYEQAHHLCNRLELEDSPELLPVLQGLRRVYTHHGLLQDSERISEQMLASAKKLRDRTREVDAHYSLGLTKLNRGDAYAAKSHLEQACALVLAEFSDIESEQKIGVRLGPICHACLAWSLWALGYPDQASRKINEALKWARLEEPLHFHPFTLAHVLFQSALASALSRDVGTTFERAESCVTHASKHDFPQWVAWGTTMQGWAMAMRGSPLDGIAMMRDGLDAAAEIGTITWRPSFMALLAEALGACGRTDAAVEALSEAISLTERTGEYFSKAELCRLKGEMILASAPENDDDAQQYFERAIEMAKRQQAKCLELRAATSLAQLWKRQCKVAKARELLIPNYGWFIEGFDTQDLKEAKALLDELS